MQKKIKIKIKMLEPSTQCSRTGGLWLAKEGQSPQLSRHRCSHTSLTPACHHYLILLCYTANTMKEILTPNIS